MAGGKKRQKKGKGRNQPGCGALPTSVFSLVNVSPRARQSPDILGMTVPGLCFLPAQEGRAQKGVKGTLASALRTSGRAASCRAPSRPAQLATALCPTGYDWKPVLNRSHSLCLLLKPRTNTPAINGWSREFKSYLKQKFTLSETEFHRQTCREPGKGNRQSQSVGGDLCWGLETLLPPNCMSLLTHQVLKVLKATLMKCLHLCPLQISEIVIDYLALPNQSLGFETFSALSVHLRGNWNVCFLGNSVISNSIFNPVWSEMSYLEIQHKMRCLKSS